MEEDIKPITDHESIKAWAIARSGRPQAIDAIESEGDKIGLRIDFSGDQDEAYHIRERTRNITWEEFFEIFENQKLAIIVSPNANSHNASYDYRFIKRENIDLGDTEDNVE